MIHPLGHTSVNFGSDERGLSGGEREVNKT
jgi:hypothetical protein